nr:hypothetical protein [Tanacetum cinerariifolium]
MNTITNSSKYGLHTRVMRSMNTAVGLIVPTFLKELICKVLGLLVSLLELNRFRILLGKPEEGRVDLQEKLMGILLLWVTSSGWPFVSIVLGQMTHLVTGLTLDNASWGGSISPEGFLPSILLVVIIVAVVIIVVPVGVVVVIGEGRKKSRGSNIGDSDNTGDEGKIVGGAIRACGGISDSLLVALYACMTFIYGSSWKGEMAREAKRYLDKSSEGSKEVFPGEAVK